MLRNTPSKLRFRKAYEAISLPYSFFIKPYIIFVLIIKIIGNYFIYNFDINENNPPKFVKNLQFTTIIFCIVFDISFAPTDSCFQILLSHQPLLFRVSLFFFFLSIKKGKQILGINSSICPVLLRIALKDITITTFKIK